MIDLETVAHVAAIATAGVAVIGYGIYRWERWQKRLRLERYLKEQKQNPRGTDDKGQRTLVHLVARVGMSETEIMDAAFRSKCINRLVSPDPKNNYADRILLEYAPQG